jgi:hypothetical protein
MSETVAVTLHGEKDTVVQSARFESQGQWFTSFEVGPLTIFASPELLRRIAEEATKAALVAEGWSRPVMPATPPPAAAAPTALSEMLPPSTSGPQSSASAAEFPF